MRVEKKRVQTGLCQMLRGTVLERTLKFVAGKMSTRQKEAKMDVFTDS